jgi:hypothetical protein
MLEVVKYILLGKWEDISNYDVTTTSFLKKWRMRRISLKLTALKLIPASEENLNLSSVPTLPIEKLHAIFWMFSPSEP